MCEGVISRRTLVIISPFYVAVLTLLPLFMSIFFPSFNENFVEVTFSQASSEDVRHFSQIFDVCWVPKPTISTADFPVSLRTLLGSFSPLVWSTTISKTLLFRLNFN